MPFPFISSFLRHSPPQTYTHFLKHTSTLVSSGAHVFAARQGVPLVPPEALIAPRAREEWQFWNRRLQLTEARGNIGSGSGVSGGAGGGIQDTVGTVALDARGGVAAGVSRCVSLSVCMGVS
jgi:isoaspartyl peptidase/L-asparaginase-like protein (Ntn-hydrolase superfamily)